MPPYNTLYIYEIKGRFPEPNVVFSEDFIGCWYEDDYSFLFFSAPKEREVQSRTSSVSKLEYRSETVLDYKNWETGKDFAPSQVGDFFLYPFWETVQVPQGLIPIKLDPGVVFGSGYHATTKKCLESLAHVCGEGVPETVLDLGCGTGILAIAAAKLGSKKVSAVDANNLAIETARKNVALNDAAKAIEVIEGDALHWGRQEADLVCANLDFRTIERLLDVPEFYNKRWYILSGMIGTEVERIKERLAEAPLAVVHVSQESFWFTITGKSNAQSS